MNHPTITRYMESVVEPHGLFRTLGEPVCERNAYREPRMYSGGNSVVFQVRIGSKHYALKCYTSPRSRTAEVCGFFNSHPHPLVTRAEYLPEELYVYDDRGAGEYRDVLLAEWLEGNSLESEIHKALHNSDAARLGELSEMFDKMALELLRSEWAHGDLKPENIMVTSNGMKLIDHDAFYIPAFEGESTPEIGTPMYRHPSRGGNFFNRHIDDYPIAIISATLKLLAADPQLHGTFGNRDRLIFSPQEIIEGRSPGFVFLSGKAAESGDSTLYALLQSLASHTPRIEWLAEILSQGGAVPSENMTPTRTGSKWGYVNDRQEWVIAPMFDAALEFTEGLACVRLGNHNHFIDTAGRCAVNCSGYESVKPFSGGLAAVRKGTLWGFIDREGREVVSPRYGKVVSMRDGTTKADGRIIDINADTLKTNRIQCTIPG